MKNKVDFLLSIAKGVPFHQYWEIHIDYQTKEEKWRKPLPFGSHDTVIEHYTPIVKNRLSRDEAEIDAMIEWERKHPEIMQAYRKDWKGIDEARAHVKDVGHTLFVDEGVCDFYADMPYYTERTVK